MRYERRVQPDLKPDGPRIAKTTPRRYRYQNTLFLGTPYCLPILVRDLPSRIEQCPIEIEGEKFYHLHYPAAKSLLLVLCFSFFPPLLFKPPLIVCLCSLKLGG